MSLKKQIPIVEEKPQPQGPQSAIPPSPCESDEPYVLMVLGDSMEPEFKEGDVIVIEPSGLVEDGRYVIARHNDDYIFRQLRIEGERFFLDALNPAYPREELNGGLDAVKGIITQKKQPGSGRKGVKHYT